MAATPTRTSTDSRSASRAIRDWRTGMSSASNAAVRESSAQPEGRERAASPDAQPPAARTRRLPAAPVVLRGPGRTIGVPLIAIALFLLVWSRLSANIETSLGHIPGPSAVWQQARALWADHQAERAKAAAFYERQRARNAARVAEDPSTRSEEHTSELQ